MNYLLDTCVFLWLAGFPEKLPPDLLVQLESASSTIFLSAASAWEITVKSSLGRLSLPEVPALFIRSRRIRFRIAALPITEEDALHLAKLPPLHSDPFDRILVCQSLRHGLTLVTPDEAIRNYPCVTLWD